MSLLYLCGIILAKRICLRKLFIAMKILAMLFYIPVGCPFVASLIDDAQLVWGLPCGLAWNCFGLLGANVYFNSPCLLGLTNAL